MVKAVVVASTSCCCKTTPLSHNLLTKSTRSSVQSKRFSKTLSKKRLVISNVLKTSKLKNASSSLSSQVQKLKASAQTCKVRTSSHNAAPIATSQHQIATQQYQIFTSFPVAGFLRRPLRGKNERNTTKNDSCNSTYYVKATVATFNPLSCKMRPLGGPASQHKIFMVATREENSTDKHSHSA